MATLTRNANQDPSLLHVNVVVDTTSAYTWRRLAGRESQNKLQVPLLFGTPHLLVLIQRPHHLSLHPLPLHLCMFHQQDGTIADSSHCCVQSSRTSAFVGGVMSSLRCRKPEVICYDQSEGPPPIRSKGPAMYIYQHFWINEEIRPELWDCPDWNEVKGWIGSNLGATCVFMVPTICEPLTSQPIAFCTKRYGYLSQLDLADDSDGNSAMSVDLLIGIDHYWNLTTGRTIRGENGPVAIHTKLGWVLSGPAPAVGASHQSASLIISHTLHVGVVPPDTKALDDTLRSFWELESMGSKDPDRNVLTQFEEKFSFGTEDMKYRSRGRIHIPCCRRTTLYHLCLKWLHGLFHRLQ